MVSSRNTCSSPSSRVERACGIELKTGLTKYDDYLSSCLANPSSYSPQTLREIMDGFREILFRHLDEEVHDLGAESMKAAGWTLAELKRIPM